SIPFQENTIRFEYAATSFDNESKNQFQYLLDGFDEDWSSWTSETKKEYTNLTEGDYTFKVRSKNVFNHIGNEDYYSFTVLAPWYRSWWAYIIYGLGAITFISLIMQWRSRELHKKNENLENLIYERTTEIQHKNELLNHQTEQMVQLNDSKTRLYSNITHEFRTPLTVILGMADTLKSNLKDKSFEGAEKSLEMIHRNGKNLLHLVNEMLDLAKVESGSMALNLVQTDAIPFVKYLSESFHSLAESKKINLTVYSEINALEMDIDVNKMASIISNLLSNAVKFTPAHGKIVVHLNKILSKNRELFSIKVQDNGLGLAKEDVIHLFDRFYQVDNKSFEKKQGTGIGLSLAKEFVELMNGTIDVDSTPGVGSTFTVQIPVTNNAAKTIDAKITIEAPLRKTTISTKESLILSEIEDLPLALIIEDNEDVAHYLKTCLQGKYQTIHANNGKEGIEMAFENIPDIIISDVMMPGKNGLEVCSSLKSDERTDHIPIILLTAKVTTKDRLTGLSHGADAYLAKPFNEEELFIRLNQLVLIRKKLVNKIQKNGLNKFLNKRSENPETKFLKKAIEFINENLHNSTFGSGELANKLHLSESQIYRKLKAITGKSTAIFIRSVRLQKAKEFIETTDKTISEIAYETGFNDPSWFSRAFKEEFGFAPSEIHK
ncbi:hybrid sensor histidine kinase/response regulator transcription factor, partial [Maribacter sp.]|uniref:hybrid sensor histidine kinase/response regulator transcription factor n=1 Tax=Maribacter sp. TaxID=1897614 RepID=UPI0025BD8B38